MKKKKVDGKEIDFDKSLQQKYTMIQYNIKTNKKFITKNSVYKLIDFCKIYNVFHYYKNKSILKNL